MPSHPKLPSTRPRNVKRALERDGWQEWRRKGSHAIMKKPGMRFPVPIPMHGKDMPKGTLKDVLRRAEITTERFLELLKR